MSVTPRKFVQAWQTSSSVEEVAKKLDMKKETISARARFYKKRGVPLKNYEGGRKIDWDELAKFAEEVLEDEGV